MLRGVVTLLSALSLVLCMATGAMWSLGSTHRMFITVLFGSHSLHIDSAGNMAFVNFAEDRSGHSEFRYERDPPEIVGLVEELIRTARGRSVFDIHIWSDTGGPTGIIAPLWAIALFFGALPAFWTVSPLRRRRLLRGHCRQCGYDLRASAERCPECGRETIAALPSTNHLDRL